ncbi:MAG: lysylphosphatidylglycerol synthase transmembrane domain-containing protein [Chloroflexota bacterium]
MQKFLVVLVLFLGIAFIILSFGELEKIAETLEQGNLWFLALALAIEFGWFVILGRTFQSIYRLLGLTEGTRHLTLVAMAANFVNVVAPSAGVGGIALFITDAKRNNHPPGKVTVAGALFLLFDYAAFLCVLALGLVVLVRRNNLTTGEITASLILLAIAITLGCLLYLGSRSAERLGNVLAWMARMVNHIVRPFIHRDYLSEVRAHAFASEIADGLSSLPEKPRSMIYPMLLALSNKAALMGILACVFLSFGVPFSTGTIVGGFAIGYLFVIVSPTPSGIGVVEGVLALALKSLRVTWSEAVIITLAYRAVTFWVPLGVGALAFRYLHLGNAKEDK